jgi:hypothetical protein
MKQEPPERKTAQRRIRVILFAGLLIAPLLMLQYDCDTRITTQNTTAPELVFTVVSGENSVTVREGDDAVTMMAGVETAITLMAAASDPNGVKQIGLCDPAGESYIYCSQPETAEGYHGQMTLNPTFYGDSSDAAPGTSARTLRMAFRSVALNEFARCPLEHRLESFVAELRASARDYDGNRVYSPEVRVVFERH